MEDEKALQKKWGKEGLCMGWTAFPTALLFMQNELGISSLEINVLLNLITHWWEPNDKIYPAQDGIASRMGVSKRTVQRGIEKLLDRGLINVKPTSRDGQYKGRNIYDLSPLVALIDKKAPVIKLEMEIKRYAR